MTPKPSRLEVESRREAVQIQNTHDGSLEWLTAFLLRAKKRERARTVKECAAVAHAEAIMNKAAAYHALAAGRSVVSEFRDSDGEACARVETRILALNRKKEKLK